MRRGCSLKQMISDHMYCTKRALYPTKRALGMEYGDSRVCSLKQIVSDHMYYTECMYCTKRALHPTKRALCFTKRAIDMLQGDLESYRAV